MKQRGKSFLWIALLSLLAFSCQTGNYSGSMDPPQPEPTAEKRLIPMEDALSVKHSASDYTYSMKEATSEMLANNKPVFISALPRKFWKGHSWVIDGAKYSATDSYNYLLGTSYKTINYTY